MPRDGKGRFKKIEDEGMKLSFKFPSLKTIINWVFILTILMPWIVIILRYNAVGKILKKFEEFITLNGASEEIETPKKNGLFY